jgi:hypothetical protein
MMEWNGNAEKTGNYMINRYLVINASLDQQLDGGDS